MPKVGRILGLLGALTTAACGSHAGQPTPIPQPQPIEQPPPPPPPPPPTLRISRILAFGDSLTEGTTSSTFALHALTAGKPESYPFKLQTLESERYSAQAITVLNAGQAGEAAQSSGASRRLAAAISEGSPDVLLLMEGANDLISGANTPNTTIAATVNALEDMVRDTTRRGITVLLATIPPQRPNSQRGGNAALVTRYNDTLKIMAAKKGATIVDVYAQLSLDLIGQDGLHPTEEGYRKIAEIFQNAIAAKWEQAPAGLR